MAEAEKQIREESTEGDEPRDFYLNYVVRCDSEPTVEHDIEATIR